MPQALKCGHHFGLVRDIAAVKGSEAARCRDFMASAGSGSLVQFENMDGGTVTGKCRRNGPTDSTSGSSDRRNFTIEAEHFRLADVIDQSDTPLFQGMKSS